MGRQLPLVVPCGTLMHWRQSFAVW